MDFNLRDVKTPTSPSVKKTSPSYTAQPVKTAVQLPINQPAIKVDTIVPYQGRVKKAVNGNRKVITVISSGKGGTGKTTSAVNLALHFQQAGYRTSLIDFDTPYGDVASMLRIPDDRCLTHWLSHKSIIPPEMIDDMLMKTEEGLKVLPSIREAEEEKWVNNRAFAENVINSLQHFDVTVIDAAPHFSELTLEACRQATHILMVSDAGQVSLNNIQRGMKHLRKANIESSKVTLMVNKLSKNQFNQENTYAALTSIHDVLEVPFEPKLQEWTNLGLHPMLHKQNSKFAEALFSYADFIIPGSAEMSRSKGKRGLFGMLKWRK